MKETKKEYPAKVILTTTAFQKYAELVVTDPTGEEFNELHMHLEIKSPIRAVAEEVEE